MIFAVGATRWTIPAVMVPWPNPEYGPPPKNVAVVSLTTANVDGFTNSASVGPPSRTAADEWFSVPFSSALGALLVKSYPGPRTGDRGVGAVAAAGTITPP